MYVCVFFRCRERVRERGMVSHLERQRESAVVARDLPEVRRWKRDRDTGRYREPASQLYP